MARDFPSSSQGAKSGQVNVGGTKDYNSSSLVKSGQAPIRQSTEGIQHPGDFASGRGCVSPLGKADLGYTTNNQLVQEGVRERPMKGPLDKY